MVGPGHEATKAEWLAYIFDVFPGEPERQSRVLAVVAKIAARGDLAARDAVREASKRLGSVT